MPDSRVSKVIRLKDSQWRRLALLQAALEDTYKRKLSMDDLLEKIVDDFLESK